MCFVVVQFKWYHEWKQMLEFILGTNERVLPTLRTSCRSCCGSMQVSILSSRSMMADVPMCLIIKSTKSSRFRRKSTICKHKAYRPHSLHIPKFLWPFVYCSVPGWCCWTFNWSLLIILLWQTYLFWLASYKNGQDLGEKAGQEWVERRLTLEEAIKFHQQFFIFSQSLVYLAHIWCKQLTWYVGIPGKSKVRFLMLNTVS